MRVVSFPTGIAIEGEFPQPDVVEAIRSYLGEDKAALSVVDPPYGKVVPNGWDHEIQDPKEFSDWMVSWTKVLGSFLHDNAALYVWGGTVYRCLVDVESAGDHIFCGLEQPLLQVDVL